MNGHDFQQVATSSSPWSSLPREKDESINIWTNEHSVNKMQSIWAKGLKDRTGSSGSSQRSASTSSSENGNTSFLSNEQKKRGRLLLNQVFNELENLETDRLNYEGNVGIVPLIPFRPLMRSLDFDAQGVSQMVSECQRQFDLHVCFVNAVHAELKKVQKEPPLDKHQTFWKELADETAKERFAIHEEERFQPPDPKVAIEKRIQKYLGNFTGEWEKILSSIQTLGKTGNPTQEIQNLGLMPFYLQKLAHGLKNVRMGLWTLYVEVQLAGGKSPSKPIEKGCKALPPSRAQNKYKRR